jgi:UrcA family protein
MFLPTLRCTLLVASLASAAPVLAQVVVQPAPVVVQPAPVVVPPGTVVQPAPVVVQPAPVAVPPAPEEIVIVGHYGRQLPDNVDSASMAISYADLDLSFPEDRRVLRQRIALTARFLCDKLGETDTGPGTCRDEATRDALRRVGTIEEHFAPRGTAWVRPAPWTPPYPVVWVQQYP